MPLGCPAAWEFQRKMGHAPLIRKRFSRAECRSMPQDWGNLAAERYETQLRLAEAEEPPGSSTLAVYAINSVYQKDPSIISRGAELVKMNLFQQDLFRVWGCALCAIGGKAEGLKLLRSAVELEPSAKNLLALAEALEDPDERMALFQEFLRDFPEDVGALRGVAIGLIDRGELEEAESYARKALGLSPNDERAVHLLAEVLFRKEDFAAALVYYKRLSKKRRNWSLKPHGRDAKRAWQQIALCHHHLGNPRRAIAAAKKLKKLWNSEGMPSDGPTADDLLEWLERSTEQ